MYEALTFPLDNIYFRFGFKFYRKIVGIPMGTNCAPLVADLFLFFIRETSCSLFQMITNLKFSRYMDYLLSYIDNNFFGRRVNYI